VPKNETEKALQDSLRNMELQCKERVDLLDALRKSRTESEKAAKESGGKPSSSSTLHSHRAPPAPPIPAKYEDAFGPQAPHGWLGDGTVAPAGYPDFSKPPPPLPSRPALAHKDSDAPSERSYSSSRISSMVPPSTPPTYSSPTLPVPPKKTSRTPSPEKKGGHVMLTTLRGARDGKRPSKPPRASGGRVAGPPPASSKAAGLAWDGTSKYSGQKLAQSLAGRNGSTITVDSLRRDSAGGNTSSRPESTNVTDNEDQTLGGNSLVRTGTRTPPDLISMQDPQRPSSFDAGQRGRTLPVQNGYQALQPHMHADIASTDPPKPQRDNSQIESAVAKTRTKSPVRAKGPVDYPSYRTEFPPTTASSRATAEFNARANVRREDNPRSSNLPTRQKSPQRRSRPPVPSNILRRPVANSSSPRASRTGREDRGKLVSSESNDENTSSSHEVEEKKRKAPRKTRNEPIPVDPALASTDNETGNENETSNKPNAPKGWEERFKYIQKHLPKGVDEGAAKQIFNEIVVRGDEVHWDDVAGLEVAKKALKEAVVYPFLRPDLFMGLREPARGMLLFGPPGTGKTMLARAVATESRSTFFAISASSLTSKWLGESEKLVRALFSLAKALAPSIIFVDEIDSLLSSRGGSSEHESTRRIKTEFLIQWSDLQRAAAGKQQTKKEEAEGDASRVLVLAATNMPWAIDEAARRRFVRRQYIPLPEAPVRAEQLRTLLGHQKHNLNKKDIQVLVELTDGTPF